MLKNILGIIGFIFLFNSSALFALEDNVLKESASSYVEENLGALKAPGGIVGVVNADGIFYLRAFGYSNLEDKVVPQKTTLFRIGSLSKTFTGLSYSILKQRGMLRDDDLIEQYIPKLKDIKYPSLQSSKITIENLFTHSSGISRMADLPESASIDALIDWLSQSELEFYPGERFSYSNLAIGIFGAIVQIVANEPFEDFVKKEILKPLNMKNTSYHEADIDSSLRSYGYEETENGFKRIADPNLVGLSPAGAMYSNLEDLAKYMQFQFKAGFYEDDLPVDIYPLALQEMHKPHYFIDSNWNDAIGVTWFINRNDRLNSFTVGHGGNIDGYATFFKFDPRREFGIIVLANNIEAKTDSFGTGLIEKLQSLYVKEEIEIFQIIGERLIQAINHSEEYNWSELFHPVFLSQVSELKLSRLFKKLKTEHGEAVSFIKPFADNKLYGGGEVIFEDGINFKFIMTLTKNDPARFIGLLIK